MPKRAPAVRVRTCLPREEASWPLAACTAASEPIGRRPTAIRPRRLGRRSRSTCHGRTGPLSPVRACAPSSLCLSVGVTSSGGGDGSCRCTGKNVLRTPRPSSASPDEVRRTVRVTSAAMRAGESRVCACGGGGKINAIG